MYTVHYLTYDDKCIMYVAQEKRIPLETRQSLRFVSFLVYINDELMTCLDITPE